MTQDQDYDIEKDIRALSAQEIDILNEDDSINHDKLENVMNNIVKVMNFGLSAQKLSCQYLWDLSVQIQKHQERSDSL